MFVMCKIGYPEFSYVFVMCKKGYPEFSYVFVMCKIGYPEFSYVFKNKNKNNFYLVSIMTNK